ncbi:MAG: helicase c2 [Polaromonas sp.]|nr:helicase c2 [Polaromonas sp.]
MNLAFEVNEAFSSQGILSQHIENFVPRNGQIEMALAVTHAIEEGRSLVVEASTGIGKTFSYLVPALLSSERVLISTATKALQDQLFGSDLPRLVDAFNLPVRIALLKGRTSYLCLYRLETARQETYYSNDLSARALSKVEQWSQVTKTGDLAELGGLDERSPIIPFITSTKDNCLGSQCPRVRACHVNLARREAMAADVVVINHHLFFADLAVRESGVAELLPSVRIVIFDEAHQLNETGVQFLGNNLSTGQMLDFCSDVLIVVVQLARGLMNWHEIVGAMEKATRDLRKSADHLFLGTKLRWTGSIPEGLVDEVWEQALQAAHVTCLQVCAALDTVSQSAPDFVRLHERGLRLADRMESFAHPGKPGFVRWVDVGTQLRLVESPVNISSAVKSKMLSASPGAVKSWIFTSATLGDDEKLSWFTQPCGLEDAKVLRIGSPFDYERQAALYVPPDFPKPGNVAHPGKVAECAAIWASQLCGRTMILTTTLHALRVIGDKLQSVFENSGQLQVLVQGSMPKRALIERFREGASLGRQGCILVGSASFWEGIDLPGDVLQLLIIDKIPFPPPTDPLAEARSCLLETEGRSPFIHYFLPEAAVALKQGAGRLIRRETDQGVLVVCDNRLVSMGYGRRLLKALPPMQRLASDAELMNRLIRFTKTCTKDCLQP